MSGPDAVPPVGCPALSDRLTWLRAAGSAALEGSADGVFARVQHLGYPKRFVLTVYLRDQCVLYQAGLTTELEALKMAQTFISKEVQRAGHREPSTPADADPV